MNVNRGGLRSSSGPWHLSGTGQGWSRPSPSVASVPSPSDQSLATSSVCAFLALAAGLIMYNVTATAGCANQACGSRDIYQELVSAGYDDYCLSADVSAAQFRWQTKVCLLSPSLLVQCPYMCLYHFQKELPYHILSYRHRVLIVALRAGDGEKTKRSHFIFEKGDKLVGKAILVKPNDRYALSWRNLIWGSYI